MDQMYGLVDRTILPPTPLDMPRYMDWCSNLRTRWTTRLLAYVLPKERRPLRLDRNHVRMQEGSATSEGTPRYASQTVALLLRLPPRGQFDFDPSKVQVELRTLGSSREFRAHIQPRLVFYQGRQFICRLDPYFPRNSASDPIKRAEYSQSGDNWRVLLRFP